MTALVEVPSGAAPAAPRGRAVRWVAVLGTAAAGVLHVVAAAGHVGAGDLVVGFFLLTALAQVGAAAWLATGTAAARDARFLLAVVAGTAGLLLLYVVGHTTDLLDPFLGHDHSTVGTAAADHTAHSTATGPVALDLEPVETTPAPVLGTVTAAAEVLALAAAAALLPAGLRRRVLDGLLAVGALVWVLWLTGVLG